MAQQVSCDGCGKAETAEEQFVRKGYIDTVDYCPECVVLFETYDRERRNLAAESSAGYIEVARMNRENFLAERPDFRLPDGDED